MKEIKIRKAKKTDIKKIMKYIEKFNLDGEEIKYKEFIVAEIFGEITGFARMKKYEGIYELATLGVIEKYRNKKIGSKLVNHLLQNFEYDELWLTTIIPEFFEKFGFIRYDNAPDEIKNKCHRICLSFKKDTNNSCYMKLGKKAS